jgi:tetratricopeptide (TPR) repeat protein
MAFVMAGVGGVAAWRLHAARVNPLQQGLAAYRQGDWSEASAQAIAQLKSDQADRGALRLLARASARLGRDTAAQNYFRRLGARDAEAEDFQLLAATLLRQGDLSQALLMLERANQADPDHAETLYELSGLYGQVDRLAEATDLAKRLSGFPAWAARAHAQLGVLFDQQNDPVRAAHALGLALQTDSSLRGARMSPADARIRWARALLKQHMPAEARALLETAVASRGDRETSWLLSRAAIQQGDRASAIDALAAANAVGSEPPETFEPGPYIGSARCAECHAEVHRFEQAGRHARTFRPTDALPAIPLPEKLRPDPVDPEVQYVMTKEGDQLALETRVHGKEYVALVDFLLGSGKHACTPVGHDPDGQPIELRFSYYAAIGDWDVSPGHPAHPGDDSAYLGERQTRDSLRRCLNCHTTNFRGTLEHAGPEALDRGIGCERCHGPGGNHLAAVELGLADPAIARFKASSEARAMALCAQCHGTRGRQVQENNPAFMVRFQATTLTWSKCYKESREALGCLTCHSPHRDAGARSATSYESRCLACHAHDTRPPATNLPSRAPTLPEGARRAICPVNSTGGCLSCHMPLVKGAVPHTTFTDHHIRIHPSPSAARTRG